MVVQGMATVAVLVQCAGAPQPAAPAPTPVATTAPSSTAATMPPADPAPAPADTGVYPVSAAELGPSWRPGCPVEPEQLRRVSVDFVGFDGQPHSGELVVHEDVVAAVVAVFAELYRLGYPIDKMRTVNHYSDAADELSMEDNNTSAFSCRGIPGTDRWSEHAYGRAVDVNPLVNPSVDPSGRFEPQTAGPYLDRSRSEPGMLRAGDPAVVAFTDRGWQWGGYWRAPVDYQHFELP